jgi:hypothetical protein
MHDGLAHLQPPSSYCECNLRSPIVCIWRISGSCLPCHSCREWDHRRLHSRRRAFTSPVLIQARALSCQIRADYPTLLLTIKVDYSGQAVDKDELTRDVEKLARSLVYELDVRNGRVISLTPRQLVADARRSYRLGAVIEDIRYPKVEIQPEVADLFNFAGQAYENPPLAFLSYYQTLEYFIPAAVRRSALSKIRRELNDPTFDTSSDRCVMRILSATERSMRLPESDQIRIMVREEVRLDRLEEFLAAQTSTHFSKHGPISGVDIINQRDPAKGLADQVADRIYQIRNRIVHAKDDPRYDESRVLLPRGPEAQALGPDIELVRLLACEAVLSGQ